jgi:hypothetical protein
MTPTGRASCQMRLENRTRRTVQCVFDIGAHGIRLEPGARRYRRSTALQVTPQHRLEFQCRIVSFECHCSMFLYRVASLYSTTRVTVVYIVLWILLWALPSLSLITPWTERMSFPNLRDSSREYETNEIERNRRQTSVISSVSYPLFRLSHLVKFFFQDAHKIRCSQQNRHSGATSMNF